ncbi:hypothetical protein GXB80_25175 [Paenibacillus polymyxa]|nr:hypothetical protein [Paenibacillus polymyxa]
MRGLKFATHQNDILNYDVALYVSAWTMMEQSSPGRTIEERRFIRNKKVR